MKTFLRLHGSDLAQLLGAAAFIAVLAVSAYGGLKERERAAGPKRVAKSPLLAAPLALPPNRN